MVVISGSGRKFGGKVLSRVCHRNWTRGFLWFGDRQRYIGASNMLTLGHSTVVIRQRTGRVRRDTIRISDLSIESLTFLPRCMQCRRGLAMRILSVCLSVRLSVCLSVCLSVHCDKTVERSVQIYIPYKRTFIPVFWEEEWLVGGDLFYLKFWVNQPPLERNRLFSTNNRS